ncbi:hypothetical protein ACFXEL_34380 [Streptomyces sp. NPDC059382]|uniref:hypothetical protein n=1 Tax=Streptomyces sp. NPDC059382 TaxID=3346816 RepID=UPI0036B3FE4E
MSWIGRRSRWRNPAVFSRHRLPGSSFGRVDDGATIRTAFLAWFEDVVGEEEQTVSPGAMTVFALARSDSWRGVRSAVDASVGPKRRPDLYSTGDKPQLLDQELLGSTGIARAVHAAANGFYVSAEDLAGDFARFCTSPVQDVEEWLLLDGRFPPETRVALGEYTLQTLTDAQLSALRALPSMDPLILPTDLVPSLLDGATFLHRVSPDFTPQDEARRQPLLHTRPEILHWKPLITLLLWQDSRTLRMEALYTVQRGRGLRRLAGAVATEPRIYPTAAGEEEFEVRPHSSYRVAASELPRLAAFCSQITGRITSILADATSKPAKKRARRLARAAEHLVRATHRTFGENFVWTEEVDEVVLHYVIAMEALLADEDNLDLSRKVAYRAASMWRDDSNRTRVLKIVKNAYGRRSSYAHGDDTSEISATELATLRSTAMQVLLRWLILSATPDLPHRLDESQLSDAVRQATVTEPLTAFFRSTPPASAPQDA